MDYCARETTLCEGEAPVKDVTLKNILDEINKMLCETESILSEVSVGISGQKKPEDPRVACAPDGMRDDMIRVRNVAEDVYRHAIMIRKAMF